MKIKNSIQFTSYLILISFVLKVLHLLLPFEFKNQILNAQLKTVFNYSLTTTAFAWVLLNLFKKEGGFKIKGGLILLTPVLVLFLFLYLFLWISCIWENSKVLYYNKNNNSIIIDRWLDCGETTNHTHKIMYLKPLNKYINYIQKIDTLDLHKNEWINVPPNNSK